MSAQPWILKRSNGFNTCDKWWEIWVDNRTPVLQVDSYHRHADGETECVHGVRIYGDFAERIAQVPVLEEEVRALRVELLVAMEQAELLEAELAKIRAEDALWEVAERDVR